MSCDDDGGRKALKFIGTIPVLLCLSLIAWSYYAFVPRLCLPLLAKDTPLAVFYLIVYHLLFIPFVWSYLMVVFVHPGTPSDATRRPLYDAGTTDEQPRSAAPKRVGDSYTQSVDGFARQEGEPAENSPVGPYGSPTQVAGVEMNDRQRPPDGRTTSSYQRSPAHTHVSIDQADLTVTVKRNGEPRFCTKCSYEKPDRSHHCRICGECVLKMDHHCPWINGCVGFRNQKHFVLFISWGALYCLFIAAATLPAILRSMSTDWNGEFPALDIQWAFLILCGGLFGISLLAFSAYHIHLILSNQTTIESYQKHNYRSQGGLAPARHVNVFDIGRKRNFKQVMGERWYLWFIPISNSLGNGIIYPLNSNSYSALAVGFGDRRLPSTV